MEYAWKEMKRRAEAKGLDAYFPKEAIRLAARIGVIADAELWLKFLHVRNAGVHDYFGLPEEDYLKLARQFLKEAKALK